MKVGWAIRALSPLKWLALTLGSCGSNTDVHRPDGAVPSQCKANTWVAATPPCCLAVYASGVSNGGAMAHWLGCDSVASSAGGVVLSGVVGPGALSSFQEWKTHDGCTGEPTVSDGFCSSYTACDGGSEVVLCSLAPDPGGAAIDHAGAYAHPFASGFKLVDFAWAFLSRFRLHGGSS